MELSFSGLTSAVERAVSFSFDKEAGKITKKERDTESIGLEERRTMAREAMRAAFEHLSSRIILALNNIRLTNPDLASKLLSVVVSGGVASNGYLRHL
jgi:N6-L-threonylcarbamoyladenine synthase